jgi:GNAT superfamily N-acetyltransferase
MKDFSTRKISIRHAVQADHVLLAEFGAKTFRDSYPSEINAKDMADYLASAFNPQKQAAELAQPGTLFLIAESEKETAAYAMLREGSPPIYLPAGDHPIELVRIYAHRSWIGKGLGAILMQACLVEARNRGCDIIWLGVWEKNPRAIAFYNKWGFKEFGTHVFQMGTDLQTDFLIYRKL